jgi:hypothetical protein
MSRISRQILIGALTVILLSSACGRLSFASPTPVWTVPPAGPPILPTATLLVSTPTTSASMTVTPLIPITGENVVSVQCQFCVGNESQAILIFPDFAYFDVSTETPVSCLTADDTGGKRILICHGPPSTTFNLNICSDPTNCLQFPVALQPCPLLEAGTTPVATGTSFYLTPITTLKAPTKTRERTPVANTAVPSSTPTPVEVPATSTPAASTDTPTIPLPTIPLPTLPQPTSPPSTSVPPTAATSASSPAANTSASLAYRGQ